MTAITTSEVAVGDVTFQLSQSGSATQEPVLWLHGSGPGATALSNWEGVISTLAPAFHNLAPDIIGFGDSTHPDPPPDGLAAFTKLRVTTLLDLLDTLGIEKVHLVGNSMGGMISLSLAREAPERVGRIVLMAAAGAPSPPTPELMKLITFYDAATATAMAELLRGFVYDPASFGADLEKVAEARLPRALRADVQRSHLATFAPGPPVLFSADQLVGITNPTLVVHGREDRIVPLDGSLHFARHLPNAQLHVMPKTGHWLQIEQADRFTTLVKAFLGGEI